MYLCDTYLILDFCLNDKDNRYSKKEQARAVQAPTEKLPKHKSIPLKIPNKERTSKNLGKMRGPRKHQTYSPILQLPSGHLLPFKDAGVSLRPKGPTHYMRDTQKKKLPP